MTWDIQHIFMYPPISGTTINNVFLSPEFRFIIYCIIAICLILVTLYFLIKKYCLREAFQKAILTTFFTSGIIYALHADIGWATWLVTDIKNTWGLSTEQKLEKLDGDLFRFAFQAKKIISSDYELFTADEYTYYRIQYYLLPAVKREKAPYIIIFLDETTQYNHEDFILKIGNTTINNVIPVLRFTNNVYILKRE